MSGELDVRGAPTRATVPFEERATEYPNRSLEPVPSNRVALGFGLPTQAVSEATWKMKAALP